MGLNKECEGICGLSYLTKCNQSPHQELPSSEHGKRLRGERLAGDGVEDRTAVDTWEVFHRIPGTLAHFPQPH